MFRTQSLLARLALGGAAVLMMSAMPQAGVGTAQAQTATVSVEFQTALQPYGQWHRHKRWGRVWIPAHVRKGWQPYTDGHWVYSDDYGWYWNAAQDESDWGWVVYHYGRWVLDSQLGWVWVPGKEWGPAWVSWRRGHDHVGWAPLPPDPIVTEYRDQPDVWVFVRARDITAPHVTQVIVQPRQRDVYLRQTVIVNRTVVVHDRGPRFAVNPGIAPTIIAAVTGQPLHTYRVRPRIIAGTAPRFRNAIEIRRDQLGHGRIRVQGPEVEQTTVTVKAAQQVPQPQQLRDMNTGRLGDHPPQAARAEGQQQPQQQNAAGQTKTPDQQKQAEQPAGQNGKQTEKSAAPQGETQKSAGQDNTSKSNEAKSNEAKSNEAKSNEAKSNEASDQEKAKPQQADQTKGKEQQDNANADTEAAKANAKASGKDASEAEQKASQAKQNAADKTDEAKQKASEAKQRGQEKADEAKQKANDAKQRAQEKANDARQNAGDKASEAADKARSAAPNAKKPDHESRAPQHGAPAHAAADARHGAPHGTPHGAAQAAGPRGAGPAAQQAGDDARHGR